MNCPFQRAFILLDYVYVIRKSQVVYSYSVYRYSFFAIFDFGLADQNGIRWSNSHEILDFLKRDHAHSDEIQSSPKAIGLLRICCMQQEWCTNPKQIETLYSKSIEIDNKIR